MRLREIEPARRHLTREAEIVAVGIVAKEREAKPILPARRAVARPRVAAGRHENGHDVELEARLRLRGRDVRREQHDGDRSDENSHFLAASMRSFCSRETGAGGAVAAATEAGAEVGAAATGAGGGASIRSTPPPAMLCTIGSPSFVTVATQNSELCEPTGLF